MLTKLYFLFTFSILMISNSFGFKPYDLENKIHCTYVGCESSVNALEPTGYGLLDYSLGDKQKIFPYNYNEIGETLDFDLSNIDQRSSGGHDVGNGADFLAETLYDPKTGEEIVYFHLLDFMEWSFSESQMGFVHYSLQRQLMAGDHDHEIFNSNFAKALMNLCSIHNGITYGCDSHILELLTVLFKRIKNQIPELGKLLEEEFYKINWSFSHAELEDIHDEGTIRDFSTKKFVLVQGGVVKGNNVTIFAPPWDNSIKKYRPLHPITKLGFIIHEVVQKVLTDNNYKLNNRKVARIITIGLFGNFATTHAACRYLKRNGKPNLTCGSR